ncbi:GDSL lipase/acylhydrolase [Heliocybe sulcata]|uniref:GDSL lipase/acylhydrolase n=1 Tax=Heliocybe sulcata TaxID=5364 RepID=A0A5C3N0X8_9AGAM|nr:GDSL lipase/acylhydrolase [Heliocybe sulcata]
MRPSSLPLLLAALPLALAWPTGPEPNQITTLVTFGDSYTDAANPADGGSAWPTYAAAYGPFTLLPYAVSGATCSNNLTYRPVSPVMEGQVPLFIEEVRNGSVQVRWEDTAVTLWIGTNDVGVHELLTGGQRPGVTLVNTTRCAVDWVRVMYAYGARTFVFQNMLPLQLTPLYSASSYPNRYWSLQRNATEWNVFMTEITTTSNALSRLMLESLAPALPGAHIGIFDSYALFSAMHAEPSAYLNGTAPLNVTGCVNSCVFPLNASVSDTSSARCTVAEGSDRDSFLWYDELHPSEQSDRVVAREITAAIKRTSEQWITWLS